MPAKLSLPALPLFSEVQSTADRSRFNRILNRNLRGMWVLTLPLCLIVALLGRTAVTMFFGRVYGEAGSLVLLTSFTALWFVVSNALVISIASIGRMWDIFALNVAWNSIALALAWYWIPRYGSLGLASAYFVSYLAFWTLLRVHTEKRFGWQFVGNLRIMFLTFCTLVAAYLGIRWLDPKLCWGLAAILAPLLAWIEWKWVLGADDRTFLKGLLAEGVSRLTDRAKA